MGGGKWERREGVTLFQLDFLHQENQGNRGEGGGYFCRFIFKIATHVSKIALFCFIYS